MNKPVSDPEIRRAIESHITACKAALDGRPIQRSSYPDREPQLWSDVNLATFCASLPRLRIKPKAWYLVTLPGAFPTLHENYPTHIPMEAVVTRVVEE
jgi:hypothetical protein